MGEQQEKRKGAWGRVQGHMKAMVHFLSTNRLWIGIGVFGGLSVAANLAVWVFGMGVPTIVSGFVGLRVWEEKLYFDALLSVSNPNLVSVSIRSLLYDLSLDTANTSIRLGRVTYERDEELKVMSQSAVTKRMPSTIALGEHPAQCEVLRILREETFRLSADGSFHLTRAGFTQRRRLRGTEIIPKLNRTAIIQPTPGRPHTQQP